MMPYLASLACASTLICGLIQVRLSIDAEYALNPDNGAVEMKNGKVMDVAVEPTEKLYGDYQVEVTNPGG